MVRAAIGEVIPACTAAVVQAGAAAVPGVRAAAIGGAHPVPGGRADFSKSRGTVSCACGTVLQGCGQVTEARRASVGRVSRRRGIQHGLGAPVDRWALLLGVAPPLGFVPLEFARDRGKHTLPQVF
jgi:hypothetical protein